MKKLLGLFLISLILVLLSACTVEERDTYRTRDQQEHYRKWQPVHFYIFSRELEEALQIYDARNEARSTYSFSLNMMGGVIFTCPSSGFPLPYGVQLTNPFEANTGRAQAEPNGLYTTGITTEATWYLCIRTDGDAPVYSEPDVMSFPFPVQEVNGRLVDIGEASSVILDLSKPADITPPTGVDPDILR